MPNPYLLQAENTIQRWREGTISGEEFEKHFLTLQKQLRHFVPNVFLLNRAVLKIQHMVFKSATGERKLIKSKPVKEAVKKLPARSSSNIPPPTRTSFKSKSMLQTDKTSNMRKSIPNQKGYGKPPVKPLDVGFDADSIISPQGSTTNKLKSSRSSVNKQGYADR